MLIWHFSSTFSQSLYFYIAAKNVPAPTAAMAPSIGGSDVLAAPLVEVDVPPDPTTTVLVPVAWSLATPAVAVAPLTTRVASGTAEFPVPISTTFELVALKLVCAMEISLLLRSYTTYADRRKVSPSTDELDPAGAIPKTQAGVPSGNVAPPPLPDEMGSTSSLIMMEIVGEEKVKSRVVELDEREQGT